jgi:chemotaxis protein MotB
MTNKSTIFFLLLGAVILSSCGAGKKLDNANAQIADLQTQNSQLTNTTSDLKKQVSDLSTQNKTVTDQFNSYKTECQKNEQDLKDLNQALNEFTQNVMALQSKIDSAEAEFNDKGLEVHSENGVVYVDMKDNLLYKSGSAKLSEDGKKALANLASVLNEMPKLKVIVVGNTDTMHVKGVADNWSLSTERANGVVRTLVRDYQVDPSRLTAAGQGKFQPIADNSTEEGRAKNRRTEIVLNPDWDRLWESVKKGNK